MLDASRVPNSGIRIEKQPTNLRSQVLEPIRSMLYLRDCNVELLIDCPDDIIVFTDCLRLKQLILNLCRNSSKFTQNGFIRLKGNKRPDNNTVELSIEDSGPGVPPEKHGRLFSKFQYSVDTLTQGTGIGRGLRLAKKLADVMEMDLWFDASFESGLQGCPGARFVIDTNLEPEELRVARVAPPQDSSSSSIDPFVVSSTAPVPLPQGNEGDKNAASPPSTMSTTTPDSLPPEEIPIDLPKGVKLLFVDDDRILRKLFVRIIRKTAPDDWEIFEASDGETALEMIKTRTFDLIFIDQYMARIEEQLLLGTETTEALRAQGVTSAICGLSANDVRSAFEQAGANDFIFKPLPTKPDVLRAELHRLLLSSSSSEA